MTSHSSLIRMLRFGLSRQAAKLFLIVADLGGAAIIGLCTQRFLPSLPANNHIVQVWLLATFAFWLFTYDIDKNLRLNTYSTYTRVLKIACYAALSYLLFFVLTREFYSLRFLFIATIFWMCSATLVRWLIVKFSPPLRAIAFDTLPTSLQKSSKVNWTLVKDPKQINLVDYDFLLIDFRKQYSSDCQELLTHAHVVGLPILSLPQVTEYLFGKISIEQFNDFWVQATFYIDPIYLRLKRLLDLFLVVLLAPILIPLALIIAGAILLFMGRPILYWQERMGIDDKLFRMVKFRTMVKNADTLGAGSTAVNDVRITRLGAFLRKLRLDELPQFYNVLRGEMSVIGPRPEYSVLAEDFVKNIPLFQIRHWLKPGITGWAQVRHGYASNQDEMMDKIRYDLFYLKNLSFWLDLIIIFRTVVTIITGFGSR